MKFNITLYIDDVTEACPSISNLKTSYMDSSASQKLEGLLYNAQMTKRCLTSCNLILFNSVLLMDTLLSMTSDRSKLPLVESDGEASASDDGEHKTDALNENNVDIGRRNRRLAMNRITARERRRRKRQHLEDLESQVEKLTVLNEIQQRKNAEIRAQINVVMAAMSTSNSQQTVSAPILAPSSNAIQAGPLSQGISPLHNQPLASGLNALINNNSRMSAQNLGLLPSLQQRIQQELANQQSNAAAALIVLGGLQTQNTGSQSHLVNSQAHNLQQNIADLSSLNGNQVARLAQQDRDLLSRNDEQASNISPNMSKNMSSHGQNKA
jgi:hypothetical protein